MMDAKTKKELTWRLEDIREMLMERGVGGERIYGCDEWSTPVKNLTTLIQIVDAEPEAPQAG